MTFFFCFILIQMCVLRLIQVIRSVEKIEKILNSQGSKETSALEEHRLVFFLTK